MVWEEVIESLDSIIDDYERVNHLISFFQDDKARISGLDRVEPIHGVSLELGSGPGNYSRMISERTEGELVCLDFSYNMHAAARERNGDLDNHYIRGVFEALPVRDGAFGFVTAAYALRDSLDKVASFNEVLRVLFKEGKFLLVDIGKPDNIILRTGMSVYIQIMVPLIGAMAGGKRPNNPWKILYDTFKLLPKNGELVKMVKSIFGGADLTKHSLGGLVTLSAVKR